jgi:hypothetical protein
MKHGRLTGARRRTWFVVMMAAPALLVDRRRALT